MSTPARAAESTVERTWRRPEGWLKRFLTKNFILTRLGEALGFWGLVCLYTGETA